MPPPIGSLLAVNKSSHVSGFFLYDEVRAEDLLVLRRKDVDTEGTWVVVQHHHMTSFYYWFKIVRNDGAQGWIDRDYLFNRIDLEMLSST